MNMISAAEPSLSLSSYKTSFGEFIGIGDNGNLWVEGCDVADLVKRFGAPLFIISEFQLRHNYRQFRACLPPLSRATTRAHRPPNDLSPRLRRMDLGL